MINQLNDCYHIHSLCTKSHVLVKILCIMFGQVWGILEVGQKSWVSNVIENKYYAGLVTKSQIMRCAVTLNHVCLVYNSVTVCSLTGI